MTKSQSYEIIIDKLVHGGQGIGTLQDGKKALVWNALPGEKVRFVSSKSKSSYVEGIAEEILEPSSVRLESRDELFLSTSPWQIMPYALENKYKQEILAETLQREGVDYKNPIKFKAPDDQWYYRNKMEYSFYGDEAGLHLALYNRGTHRKQIVKGSSIARKEIDQTANSIRAILKDKNILAGSLKSLIIRCNQSGECVAALFTKDANFPELKELEAVCQGVAVCFSNPKSPASVLTETLYEYGDLRLSDNLLSQPVQYDVFSFFQVNIPIYEQALEEIKAAVGTNSVTDMYAGVGSIGLSVADAELSLIEIDESSIKMAEINIKNSSFKNVGVIHAPADKATDYISGEAGTTVIFDPPRAGLHSKVSQATLDTGPRQVIYLSCNPSTLARDLKILQESYKIKQITGYNFFPRTPHIEVLAILEKET
jgi:23S rRNA (uracil1939-C5)-methyltransferase